MAILQNGVVWGKRNEAHNFNTYLVFQRSSVKCEFYLLFCMFIWFLVHVLKMLLSQNIAGWYIPIMISPLIASNSMYRSVIKEIVMFSQL